MNKGGQVQVGLLNTYLKLEVVSTAVGSMGGTVKTWTTEANIWADLRHSSYQKEDYEADQKVAIDRAEAVVYSRNIKPGLHRLNSGGDIYDITGVQPVEERQAIPGRPMFIKLLLEKKDNSNG
tara:strand:- start:3080 stop:3448 length:369 start_codon:yes stop_codon:yes gene_type:complete